MDGEAADAEPTTLATVSEELQQLILEHLVGDDLARAACTHRAWRNLAVSERTVFFSPNANASRKKKTCSS